MTESLAVKHRPRSFEEFAGQRMAARVLAAMVAKERIPAGLLLVGPSGTGKTSAARVLAYSLCPDGDGRAVIEIDAASHGRVENVRELLERTRYSSGGKWRVIIIDEAHSMSRAAFDALLKALEEPSEGTVFVVVSTEPHKIPKTVRHRLLEFEFARVPVADLLDRLVAVAKLEDMKQETRLLLRFAQTSDGSVRRALMLLEKADLAGVTDLAEWEALTHVEDASLGVMEALAAARLAEAFALVDRALSGLSSPAVLVDQIVHLLRDLLVLRAGGTLPDDGAALEAKKFLAVTLSASHIIGAMHLCWDHKTRIRVHDDPVGTVNLLVSLIGNVVLQGRVPTSPRPALPEVPQPTPEPEPVPEAKRLSFEELMA